MRQTKRFAKLAVLTLVLAGSRNVYGDPADQAYDRIVENWRWSHYWFGSTGIDDVYTEGKKISALVFWSTSDDQPIRGICSTDLSLCAAYSGIYLDPKARRMQIPYGTPARDAFFSFVESGFGDASHLIGIGGLRASNFQFEEIFVVLPVLAVPIPITRRQTPPEAINEAGRIKGLLSCSRDPQQRPRSCSGQLLFAYYGGADPYWFVLRSCSAACEFGGDAVEELTRGDRGWAATSGGFINSPREEVERLKKQIQKAEMLRLQF